MASAICDGLLASSADVTISAHDPNLEGSHWGDRPCQLVELATLMAESDWLIWSVKPQIFSANTALWSSFSFTGQGMVSVMAGIPASAIESLFPQVPVIRTMPNTPMMVGEGMVAMACGVHASDEHLNAVESFFKPVAKTIQVEEKQLDGVTAISGSGPAYAFYLAEEVAKQAKQLGLESDMAVSLWAQTLRGAASMLEQGQAPEQLRAQVTSPGGTTHAAIETFELGEVSSNFGQGLLAAHQRSIELSRT
jgi:pyrroline-5-carboxylate reductase